MKRTVLGPVLLALVAACSSNPPATTEPDEPPGVAWTQTGVASWYGPKFHGRRTANGEVYDMDGMTAAHRTLPFDTRVRVENLDNGRVTEVRINDRGPFVDNRIIDLSRAAAREVGIYSSGIATVRIVVIGVPSSCRQVQVGAFGDPSNAADMVERLQADGQPARSERGADGVTRVLLGPYSDASEAQRARARYDGFIQPC